MNLTLKNQIRKLSKKDYVLLKQMCRDTKNLYNRALYIIKQHFEKTGEYRACPQNRAYESDVRASRKLHISIGQYIGSASMFQCPGLGKKEHEEQFG